MLNDFTRLKEIRKEKGFTIAGISKQLGVPIRTYENWENGYRIPSIWLQSWILEKIRDL